MSGGSCTSLPAKELSLPALRQDLSISPGGLGEDGGANWLLYDPLKNKYYRIGQIAFRLISAWKEGACASQWLANVQKNGEVIAHAELEQLLGFLKNSGLTCSSGNDTQQHLEYQYAKNAKQGVLKWLLAHYIFFRIPLVNPDRFLGATLPFVSFFFHPLVRWLVRAFGLVGILLILRQWDTFVGSLMHFFTLSGALCMGLALFLVKALHEMGHAYTAKRQGCRVPCMGVAFILFYPLLYTDTTDAWRLTSPKQRLAITTAGIKAELAVAFLASFAWSFLDDGVLRSILFFVATTSWITSLGVNLTPFMRFDGYYAFSDFLGAENLQERSFALGRWRLRKFLFGLADPPPEALSRQRQTIFIIFAYSTWVYRFFLFLGIALLVYHFTFKALGIVLGLVAFYSFIVQPVMREVRVWFANRSGSFINARFLLILVTLVLLFASLIVPWQGKILLPAVLEVDEKVDIYPGEDGVLRSIQVEEGQYVKQGQLLFELTFPELEKKAIMLERQVVYLQARLDRHVGSRTDLKQLDVLQKKLAKVLTNLDGIHRRMELGYIHAPKSGRISKLIQAHSGQWVATTMFLAQIIGKDWTYLTAYVDENQLHRVKTDALALFYDNSGGIVSLPTVVTDVSATAVQLLPHYELASVYGGPIAVRQLSKENYRPENGLYKITLKTKAKVPNKFWRTIGTVRIEASAESPIFLAWRYAASVFIRESGL